MDSDLELAARTTDLVLAEGETTLEVEDRETEVDHPRELELALDG